MPFISHLLHSCNKLIKLVFPCPIQFLSFTLPSQDERDIVPKLLKSPKKRCLFRDLKSIERIEIILGLLQGCTGFDNLGSKRLCTVLISTIVKGKLLFQFIALFCSTKQRCLYIVERTDHALLLLERIVFLVIRIVGEAWEGIVM